MAVDREKLYPYSNKLLEIFNRLEETIPSCYAGAGPFGMCMYCPLENGMKLNFTVDPYIDFGSTVKNPEKIDSFTVTFVVYTSNGESTHEMTSEEVDKYLQSKPIDDEKICSILKEMAGYEVVLDRNEYFEAHSALVDRERREAFPEIEEALPTSKKNATKSRKSSQKDMCR